MHLPIFPLVSGTARCLLCLERVGMDRFNRKAPEDVLDPAVHDVVALYLWQGLAEVAGAKGALVIRKLDGCDLCPFLALETILSCTENKRVGDGGDPARLDKA